MPKVQTSSETDLAFETPGSVTLVFMNGLFRMITLINGCFHIRCFHRAIKTTNLLEIRLIIESLVGDGIPILISQIGDSGTTSSSNKSSTNLCFFFFEIHFAISSALRLFDAGDTRVRIT